MNQSPTYITALCVVAMIVAQASTRSATPGPRIGHGLAFDEARGRTVLFGGFGPDGAPQSDTWEWDGNVWRELRSDEGPSGRDHHTMVYDRARRTIVVFGGWDGERVVGDTWEWSGEWNGKWQRAGRNGPPARAAHAMTYDEKRGTVYGDTWVWDGQRWAEVPVDGPSKRYETWLWNGSQWQTPDR